MNPGMTIFESLKAMIERDGRAVLVTIMAVWGSSPREPGTRMAVRADGAFSGTIGGGTLEWQVLAEAQALLSGAGQLIADVVSDFGEKVGVAFQIADDVLDLASSGEQSGKTPGTDLREGVDTLPILLLRRREAAGTIDEAGARILRELTGDLSSDEALASVVEQLRSHDVLEETRELARTWADDAVAVLAPLPKGEAKTALEAFANLMVDRLV